MHESCFIANLQRVRARQFALLTIIQLATRGKVGSCPRCTRKASGSAYHYPS